jgi:choline dehydrogenase-like flavoprotein
VLPYFRKAEHNERGADAWHGGDGPLNVMDLRSPHRFGPIFVEAGKQAGYRENRDFNGAEQEGVGLYQVTHKNGERFSAAKAYLAPNRARPNLRVETGAHATRILFEGKRAVGVEYRLGAETKVLRARREVLLSAGALLSPQLLMLSGVGPAEHLRQHGIPVLHDLPASAATCTTTWTWCRWWMRRTCATCSGCRRAAWSTPSRASSSGASTARACSPPTSPKPAASSRATPAEPLPDLQLHFVIGKLVDHGRKTVFGHGYFCHVCLLRPKSRGSVQLASADPLAAPRIDPNFLGDPDDLRRLVRGFKAMRNILAQPALAGIAAANWRLRPARPATRRSRIRAQPRRHHLPPGRQLPHGQRPAGRGGCAVAGARAAGPARGRRLGHARHRGRQHQCAGHHDRREGGRPGPRRASRQCASDRDGSAARGSRA